MDTLDRLVFAALEKRKVHSNKHLEAVEAEELFFWWRIAAMEADFWVLGAWLEDLVLFINAKCIYYWVQVCTFTDIIIIIIILFILTLLRQWAIYTESCYWDIFPNISDRINGCLYKISDVWFLILGYHYSVLHRLFRNWKWRKDEENQRSAEGTREPEGAMDSIEKPVTYMYVCMYCMVQYSTCSSVLRTLY